MKKKWKMKGGVSLYIPPKWLNVMKLTVCLVFLLNFSVVAIGFSQNEVVNIELKKASVEKVFEVISQQTSLLFFYNHEEMMGKGLVDVKYKDTKVEKVLEELGRQVGFSYRFTEKYVVITPVKAVANDSIREKMILRGIVRDAEGKVLPGVTVLLKGTLVGVATDAEGKFVLTIPKGKSVVLLFSFVGMKAREVVYTGQKLIEVVMYTAEESLDDVVVTGYQQLNKERATGSFTTVKKADLDKQLGALSVAEKFQSLIPGVLVNADGSFTIRGRSSLNADLDPIVVVDGFPMESSISTLNPNDIESITILKDAAAASIWGVRASNGVIVITTRSGHADGKPLFSASASWRVQDMPKLSSLHLANASDFVDYELEALQKGWYNTDQADNNFGYSRVWEIFSQQKKGTLTEAQAQEEYDKLRTNSRDGQKDLFFRKGVAQQYDLSVSGGYSRNKYYLSANYQNRDSYAKGDRNDLLKVMLKNSFVLRDYLVLDATVSVSYDKGKQNGVSVGDFTGILPYMPFADEDGGYVYEYSTVVSNETNAKMMEQGYYDWRECLKRELDYKDNQYTDLVSRYHVGFNFKLIRGLSWDSRFQYENRDYKRDNYYSEELHYNRYLMNRFTILNSKKQTECQLPKGLIYSKYRFDHRQYSFRNQLNFDGHFNDDKHVIAAILGTEVSSLRSRSSQDMLMNYDKHKLTYTPFMSSAQFKMWNGNSGYFTENHPTMSETENRYFSLYFNGAYTYSGRYSFSVSARLDESNLFGASTRDRKTPLYSVGVAWNISNEEFFEWKFINFLKLRLTTGKNGNIDKKTSKELIAKAWRSTSTGENYLSIEYPANPDLKWETTRIHNIGLDFGFWDNRVSGTLEYYNKKSVDLLAFAPGDPSFGFKEIYRNTAEMKNRGYNFNAEVKVFKGEVSWDVAFHLSYNKNRVTKVYSPSTVVANFLTGVSGCEVEGKPIDYLYNYRWAGLNKEGEPQIYDDGGNVHLWNEEDLGHKEWLVYSGSITPRYFGAFNTTLGYRGVTFNMILNYKLGHVMRMPSSTLGRFNLAYDDIAGRWQKPGDEAHANIPRMYDSVNDKQERTSFYRYNDYMTESASFIRLSTLNLSYDFPAAWLSGYLKSVRLYVQGSNLGFWAKNSRNLDPERVSPRYGELSIESAPLYTFGLNVSF